VRFELFNLFTASSYAICGWGACVAVRTIVTLLRRFLQLSLERGQALVEAGLLVHLLAAFTSNTRGLRDATDARH
jgi:hypothetical protein